MRGCVVQVEKMYEYHKNTTKMLLRELLLLLLNIIRAKRSLIVKARDLRRIYGINSHHMLTQMGKLLNQLVRMGFADRLNSWRPTKYRLKPRDVWIYMAKYCSFQCIGDGTACSLIGICPYHKLLEVKNRE